MTTSKERTSPFHGWRKEKTIHWKDSREMHRVMRRFPGSFTALLLELLDKPMTKHEIRKFLQHLGETSRPGRGVAKLQLRLEKELDKAKELRVLQEQDGVYHLTAGGREMAEHMQEHIPQFIGWILSVETVTKMSIWVYVSLSILKLVVGFLSRSAGLIADGIDNTVDTVSAVLVYFGIKCNKEKLVSYFIVITMFISVGGVALATYEKIANPGPVEGGSIALAVSAVFGLVMLGLSSYQYMVGRRLSNMAILCQAVDSRNHFWTSLLVCIGILLSILARVLQTPWLYHADPIASAIIGLLILRGALELCREVFKPADERAEISHFMKSAMERTREKIIFEWLQGHLLSEPLTREELVNKFADDFCEHRPKIFTISGIGYLPRSGADLEHYLDRFVERKKLILDEGKYWIVARS